MVSLSGLGGSEFIVALKHLGFRVTARGAGLSTMHRRHDAVVVPETAALSPALVGAMLRSAAVEPLDFKRVVDEGRSAKL